ncbi:protein PHYTOCHROME KINASE SUBSTRATE 3 [Forsythia ovata]|uniref:Protein PHYTOCHROME KINASE SUBSTRATE 3 n=1 Tax=Forsythia ovata TaxID=205694 RepID=A0ABD1TMK4_9LAMI
MEGKLSMLTWDAIRKRQNLPTSTLGSITICEYLASDVSSDLFEIENIYGTLFPLLTADQETDNMSICMSPRLNTPQARPVSSGVLSHPVLQITHQLFQIMMKRVLALQVILSQ